MKDTYGRPYAKLSDLRPGDKISLDDDFTCMSGNKIVQQDTNGELFVSCRQKGHWLNGQLAEDREHLIGIYHFKSV